MAGRSRSGKSKAARRRNIMRQKNRRDSERLQESHNETVADEDDGCLFMRAFGTAREVINVTRILSGMPSVQVERDDNRTPLSVEIQGEKLDELTETIEQLGPELKTLCVSKTKSIADKAKEAAKNSGSPTPGETIPSDALVYFRRGKAISSNSLHLTASGRAKSISNYIRILSGLPKVKSVKKGVETLDIEGENLEELLVCLEKLGSSFKKRPRQSPEETVFDSERREPFWGNGRQPRSNQGRARSGNNGGRPPRRERRQHRRDMFAGDERIGLNFLSFLLRRLLF